MHSSSMVLIATSLACFSVATPANAQSIRTFVSAGGSDGNPCSITQPCRHFQAAVTATSPGGEVDALDPGAYGSFTIDRAISIEGQGWSYIAPGANGNAITINAGSGNVAIHGVSLNGAGATGGTNGIVFNSGGGLTITDCVLQNFSYANSAQTGNGILMQPSAGAATILITNTTVANNGFVGLYYGPHGSTATASVTIDRVVATNNGVNSGGGGITINVGNGAGATTFSITNAIANNNGGGISVVSDNANPLAGTIDNSTSNNNRYDGIYAGGIAKVTLSRLTVAGNGQNGIWNNTTSNTVDSFGNNQVGLNHTDFTGTLNKAAYTLQ